MYPDFCLELQLVSLFDQRCFVDHFACPFLSRVHVCDLIAFRESTFPEQRPLTISSPDFCSVVSSSRVFNYCGNHGGIACGFPSFRIRCCCLSPEIIAADWLAHYFINFLTVCCRKFGTNHTVINRIQSSRIHKKMSFAQTAVKQKMSSPVAGL